MKKEINLFEKNIEIFMACLLLMFLVSIFTDKIKIGEGIIEVFGNAF